MRSLGSSRSVLLDLVPAGLYTPISANILGFRYQFGICCDNSTGKKKKRNRKGESSGKKNQGLVHDELIDFAAITSAASDVSAAVLLLVIGGTLHLFN